MATVDQEVHRVERATVLAQQRVGLLAIVAMWAMFQSVNPLNPLATYGSWYAQSMRIARAAAIMFRRIHLTSYRLTRALDLQETVSLDGDMDDVFLGELRQEFVDAVEESLGLGSWADIDDFYEDALPDDADPVGEFEMPTDVGVVGDPDIDFFYEIVADMREDFAELADRLTDKETRSADVVRDLAGSDTVTDDTLENSSELLSDLLDEMLSDPSLPHYEGIVVDFDVSDMVAEDQEFFEDKFAQEARDEFEESIRQAYIEELENRVSQRIKSEDEMREARDDVQRIADEAGLNASAWLEELAKRQGTILYERIAAADNKLLYAARKTGSNPCAWCAMLASRGYVYTGTTAGGTYRTTSRGGNKVDLSDPGYATTDAGFRKYHPNCQCTVVYRFDEDAQADSVNKWFKELWDSDAVSNLNDYRKLLDEIRRENGGSLNLYF